MVISSHRNYRLFKSRIDIIAKKGVIFWPIVEVKIEEFDYMQVHWPKRFNGKEKLS